MIDMDVTATQNDVTTDESVHNASVVRESSSLETLAAGAPKREISTEIQPTQGITGANAFSTPAASETLTAGFDTSGLEHLTNGHEDLWKRSDVESRVHNAQAGVLFDPVKLSLLRKISEARRLPVDELHSTLNSPSQWITLGSLMQALFVEVVGRDLFITPEGDQAIKSIERFTKKVRDYAAE